MPIRRPLGSAATPDADQAVAIHLSPDDQYLAVVTADKQLTVYRLEGESLGEQLGSWAAEPSLKVAWSDSGESLAFVSSDGDIRIVHLPGGRSSVVPGPATAVAFYPDASRLAVLHGSSLRIQELGSHLHPRLIEVPRREAKDHDDDRFLVVVSPDARWIACTEMGTIWVLDPLRPGISHELAIHQGIITGLEWIGPNVLASCSADETIRIWQIDKGAELRVLEAGRSLWGIAYAPDLQCVVGWTSNSYLFWSITTGDIRWQGPLATRSPLAARKIAASRNSTLVVTLTGPALSDIKFSRGWDASPGNQPHVVTTYANAKVLLLGDSGVGKSGMALVLADEKFRATESTHARRIWRMPVAGLIDAGQAQREILIWDLAGQPGYRVVHQLHLHDASVAMILFDSSSETRPMAGIGYWARALQHARATVARSNDDALPVFLVAARTDRSVVNVSNERIAEAVSEFGFRAYFSTSAMTGWGIADLRRAVLAAIDWTRIPVVTSSVLFAAAKSFVLDQKAAGILLTPLASLHAAFVNAPVADLDSTASRTRVGGDLLGFDPNQDEDGDERLRHVFEGCIARLESAGLVKRLEFADLVLLQPELIDVYAGAIVNAARDEPDGLGSILESDVLAVNFQFPQEERIADAKQERLLVIATLEELIRHETVLREETEQGVQLVFPAAFRSDLPDPTELLDNTLQFAFEGPVMNIYATLIVRLTRSDRFSRRGAWQSAARFEAITGGMCTVHLVRSDEGRGTLQLGYDKDVHEIVQDQFERFIMTHLNRRAIPETVRRTRLYRCPDCNNLFTTAQAETARRRGRTVLVCPVDETRVPLESGHRAQGASRDEVTREMDASADAARSIAAASSVILGKEETTDFDVFMCHNDIDKSAVRWTAQRLRERGILPWLDRAELRPGQPWPEELQRRMNEIPAVAVFIGPSGIGQWQKMEIMGFLDQAVQRGCRVIPVLLPGASSVELPSFLHILTQVDLRDQDEVGIDSLVWGITGRKTP
jgi:WD40 repeat protein